MTSTAEYGMILGGTNIGTENQDMELFFASIYTSSECVSKKNNEEWNFSQERKYNIDCINLVDSENCNSVTDNNAYFTNTDSTLAIYNNENFEQFCRRKCSGKNFI